MGGTEGAKAAARLAKGPEGRYDAGVAHIGMADARPGGEGAQPCGTNAEELVIDGVEIITLGIAQPAELARDGLQDSLSWASNLRIGRLG
jgi:hypothetical protein